MSQRRNPIDHVSAAPVRQAVTAGNVETAADYSEGMCPHCNKRMTLTSCGDTPSYVCIDHRTVLPVRDVQ